MKSIEKLVKKVISESMNEKAEEMTKKIHDKLSGEMAEEWGDYDFEYEEDELTDKARFAKILKRAMEKKGYLSKDEPKIDELEESMPSAEDYDYIQAESDCMEGDCGEMEESMARGEGEEYMAKQRRGALKQLYNLFPDDEHLKGELGIEDEDGEMGEGNAFTAALAKTKKGDRFNLSGKSFKDTSDYDGEMEEGNAFSGALAKAKEEGDDTFEVDGKEYEVKNESIVYSIEFKGGVLKLTENELVDMIEELVIEQKAKSKGMVEYDRVHKKDEDINQKANKESFKKMRDYVKAGSKGSFEENAKHFPKGNGELAKMDKKAYVPSEAVEEYVADFAYPGMTNLTFDEIKPDDERIKKYLEGDSTTGNSSEYANAVETEVGKKFFKNYKDNAYGAEQKEASYKRQTQPVDVAGENKGAKSYKKTKGQKALDKLSENVVKEEKENILSEEMVRMKEMIGYNKKSQ
jgi:hypothetical protein